MKESKEYILPDLLSSDSKSICYGLLVKRVLGAVLLLISLLIITSLACFYFDGTGQNKYKTTNVNILNSLGSWISYVLVTCCGAGSIMVPILLLISAYSLERSKSLNKLMEKLLSLWAITILVMILMSSVSPNSGMMRGGVIGQYTVMVLSHFFNQTGIMLLMIVLIVATVVFIFWAFSLIDAINYWRPGVRKPLRNDSAYASNIIDNPSIKAQIWTKKNRLPWISKKRLIIYQAEVDENTVPLSLKSYAQDVPRLLEPSRIVIHDTFGSQNEIIDTDIVSPEFLHNQEEPVCTGEENGTVYYGINEDASNEIVMMPPYQSVAVVEEECTSIINETEGDVPHNESVYDDEISEDIKTVFEEIIIGQEYSVPMNFLQSSIPIDSESWNTEIRRNSILLVNTLADFGIEAKVVQVNRGPVISLYEMQIAPGIKVTRIVSLADDIAMALAAYRVRIVAPIPGKSAIGVEIPNKIREAVTLGDIIKSEEHVTTKGFLVVGLGKDIIGKPVMLDLKNQPHLLIAGATGSGKSVCVNSIITSLIYNYNPNYVRFILVDPKMVELQLYNGLPHLLTPVITDPHLAPVALKWAMNEMERRYRLLSGINTRDIDKYNSKTEKDGGETIPYIVVIIDELADLMMVASKDIEGYITRIAQKARAVGIHLVIATQRPSVDVITGIIKANFPARIAFQVAQKTDSRTILDQNGAEKLLGKGDMLYQSPTRSFPIRVQGGFVTEDEIMKIVSHCKRLGKPSYIDINQVFFNEHETEEGESGNDELFVEAIKIVEETRKASASYLQRRLSIGYNRAARLIEQMEDLGYVGPQQGSKPREILI